MQQRKISRRCCRISHAAHTEIDYINGFSYAAPARMGLPYRKTPACLKWAKERKWAYERIGTGCLAPGSEETEAVTTIDLLVRGGIKVTTASVASDGNGDYHCSRGVKLLADAPLVEVADGEYDVIVLPGGIKGAECFAIAPCWLKPLNSSTVRAYRRIVAPRQPPCWSRTISSRLAI